MLEVQVMTFLFHRKVTPRSFHEIFNFYILNQYINFGIVDFMMTSSTHITVHFWIINHNHLNHVNHKSFDYRTWPNVDVVIGNSFR